MNSLQELMEAGGFVSDELVKKTITFSLEEGSEEKTYDIFVRRLSIGVHEAIWTGGGEDVSRTAKLLSEAVRFGDGSEKMSYDQAFRLNARLALAMSTAVSEVNGGGERKND